MVPRHFISTHWTQLFKVFIVGVIHHFKLRRLHVSRHLPLVPMRSSQSQGFRLHFGQHDKAAAGGERGSVRPGSPAPGRRRRFNSGGKEEGAPGGAARRSARSRECASCSSGLRVRTPAPRPAPQLRSRPRAARRHGAGDPAETAPGRADSARAELPGARIPARSAGGGGEVPPRGRCRCCGTAGRLPPGLRRPPPAGRVCLPASALRPLPVPAAWRSLSPVRTVKFQPPLRLRRVPEQPFAAPRVTALEGRGMRRRRASLEKLRRRPRGPAGRGKRPLQPTDAARLISPPRPLEKLGGKLFSFL